MPCLPYLGTPIGSRLVALMCSGDETGPKLPFTMARLWTLLSCYSQAGVAQLSCPGTQISDCPSKLSDKACIRVEQRLDQTGGVLTSPLRVATPHSGASLRHFMMT